MSKQPKRLALLIGNSEYKDNKLFLSAPKEDVTALAEVLQNPDIGGFDDVKVLIDESVDTVRRVVAGFLSKKSNRDDLLLLYYSGHGLLHDDGELYFALKETKTDDSDFLDINSLRAEFISRRMSSCRSKRQVLILDCCYSGAFVGEKGAKSVNISNDSILSAPFGGYGRIVLTASRAVQPAWEGKKFVSSTKLSLFTHYLVEGLQKGLADSNEDGYITIHELYNYAHDLVRSNNPLQNPQIKGTQEGELIIARNPSPLDGVPRPKIDRLVLVEKKSIFAQFSRVPKSIRFGLLLLLLFLLILGMSEYARNNGYFFVFPATLKQFVNTITPVITIISSAIILATGIIIDRRTPMRKTTNRIGTVTLSLSVLMLLLLWVPHIPYINYLANTEFVTASNAKRTVYTMIERQIQQQFDCPDNLGEEEWEDFQNWLNALDFRALPSVTGDHLNEYRNVFLSFLDDPPTKGFDCGYMRGELMLASAPMLVDFEINKENALADDQHEGVSRGIDEILCGELGVQNQYYLLLGFDPERFTRVRTEARMFTQYLAIWMVMFFDAERTPTVIRAQSVLLCMGPDDAADLASYADFASLHDDLISLFRALNKEDKKDVELYASRAAITLARLAQSVITEEEAVTLGGEVLAGVVKAMHEMGEGGGSDLNYLRQLIDMLRKARPTD